MNVVTEQNKDTGDIIYRKRYWWNAAKGVNGPNNNDRARNSYNKREINPTAYKHNENITDKAELKYKRMHC